MQNARNGVGRMLLGLAAGLAAFGVAIFAFNLELLAALAVGVGVALVTWWGFGLVWGRSDPVFVSSAPRVRRIVVDHSAAEAAEAAAAFAAAEAAAAAAAEARLAPPVPIPPPAAPVVVAKVAEPAPTPAVAVADLKDADLFSYPPVIRPARVKSRLLPEVDDTPEPVAVVAAEPKPSAVKAKPTVAKASPAKAAKASPAKAAAKAGAAKAAAKPRVAKVKPAGPVRLTAPRQGKADDLKVIKGVGPALEKLVNGLGFYHYDQIAGWSDADVALVDAETKTFKGRIARDKWVVQAKILAAGGTVAEAEAAART